MSIDTEIKNSVRATDKDAQYDDKAKRLLGNKIILAHILVKTVDEFRGMNPKEVVSYIEGEPLIGVVPVEPGNVINLSRKRTVHLDTIVQNIIPQMPDGITTKAPINDSQSQKEF